jgi:hypothetical protein
VREWLRVIAKHKLVVASGSVGGYKEKEEEKEYLHYA